MPCKAFAPNADILYALYTSLPQDERLKFDCMAKQAFPLNAETLRALLLSLPQAERERFFALVADHPDNTATQRYREASEEVMPP